MRPSASLASLSPAARSDKPQSPGGRRAGHLYGSRRPLLSCARPPSQLLRAARGPLGPRNAALEPLRGAAKAAAFDHLGPRTPSCYRAATCVSATTALTTSRSTSARCAARRSSRTSASTSTTLRWQMTTPLATPRRWRRASRERPSRLASRLGSKVALEQQQMRLMSPAWPLRKCV